MTPLWIKIESPDSYVYGTPVFNINDQRIGVAMSDQGETVSVRYRSPAGILDNYDEETPKCDLIVQNRKKK